MYIELVTTYAILVDCIRVLNPDAPSPPASQDTAAASFSDIVAPTTLSQHSSTSSVSTSDAAPDTTPSVSNRKSGMYFEIRITWY